MIRHTIPGYPVLKSTQRFLGHPRLWQFNRQAVAGGWLLTYSVPFAQTPLAAMTAMVLRVNLPVAVFGTLFSNPLTTPFILFVAFRIRTFVLGHAGPIQDEVIAPLVANETQRCLIELPVDFDAK